MSTGTASSYFSKRNILIALAAIVVIALAIYGLTFFVGNDEKVAENPQPTAAPAAAATPTKVEITGPIEVRVQTEALESVEDNLSKRFDAILEEHDGRLDSLNTKVGKLQAGVRRNAGHIAQLQVDLEEERSERQREEAALWGAVRLAGGNQPTYKHVKIDGKYECTVRNDSGAFVPPSPRP